MDYSKICFVIMPFGKKSVGDQMVDFDPLYNDIFVPAISAVALPEGGKLEPRRTDKDFFTGRRGGTGEAVAEMFARRARRRGTRRFAYFISAHGFRPSNKQHMRSEILDGR